MKKLGILVLLLCPLCSSCEPEPPSWENNRDQIERIFQLASVDMVFREVIYHSSKDRFFEITYNTNEVLFAVDLTVQAGFDLAKGYEIRPVSGSQVLEIHFPDPEILQVDADEASLYQYLTTGQPLGYLKLQSLFQDRHEFVRQEALRQGILEQAKQQAKTFLTGLFSSLGYKSVQIIFGRPEIESTS